MKGYDEASTSALDLAALILCNNEDQRQLLQEVYNLGRKDGAIESIKKRLDELKEAA